MITPTGNFRVFFVAEQADFRNGMVGLSGTVASAFGPDGIVAKSPSG